MNRTGRNLLVAMGAVALVVAQAAPAVAKTSRPSPVSHLKVSATSSSSISLNWRNPTSRSVTSIVVRYASGTRAPATRRSGHALVTLRKPHHSYTKHGLRAGTHYAFAVFVRDRHGHYSTAKKIVATTRRAASPFNGRWSGKAVAPGGGVSELVTFTVSSGRVINFQGWIWGVCSNGSLDDVFLGGPAPIRSNGSVARAESITPVPGYTATSSMTGFFHGRTANGTIDYVFAGCAESLWTWTAARA